MLESMGHVTARWRNRALSGCFHTWGGAASELMRARGLLNRIVHGSHKIALKGESMRKLTKAV